MPDPIEGVWEISNRYWYQDDDTLYADPTTVLSLAMKEANNGKAEFVLSTELDQNFLKQEMPVPKRDTIYQVVEEWKRLN